MRDGRVRSYVGDPLVSSPLRHIIRDPRSLSGAQSSLFYPHPSLCGLAVIREDLGTRGLEICR